LFLIPFSPLSDGLSVASWYISATILLSQHVRSGGGRGGGWGGWGGGGWGGGGGGGGGRTVAYSVLRNRFPPISPFNALQSFIIIHAMLTSVPRHNFLGFIRAREALAGYTFVHKERSPSFSITTTCILASVKKIFEYLLKYPSPALGLQDNEV